MRGMAGTAAGSGVRWPAMVGGSLLMVSLLIAPLPARAAWPPAPDSSSTAVRQLQNWPNDPEYGFFVSSSPSARRGGQWQFYSYIPERSDPALAVHAEETAAGMSVDLAWRQTIGQGAIVIAIIDSGIAWDTLDLTDKVRLNLGELAGESARPVRADQSPCAPLDPVRPLEALVDCNGDGLFTVADYAEHPGLEPAGPVAGPRGDKNGNGILDPGDLLQQPFLGNGRDDDQNGYTDDLAGWDFVERDADPEDVLGKGSGTARALEAAAATNNGSGGAGACPLCRVLPLRVTERDVAGSAALAEAVVYAVDNGASIIALPIAAVSRSPYLQAALDYAWTRSTLVLSSVGEEYSRRHQVLASSNHVLPVGAVTLGPPGSDSTTAETFLAFSACSNFGGQRLLSVSSTQCSQAAVGLAAGVAGLVASEAWERGLGNLRQRLSAAEMLHLLTSTAEDVDILESRTSSSRLAWSQPGFDQRFGYGRANADRAVAAVADGRIPPEVDLTEPAWFETLYPDRVTSAISIVGTVGARRAQSYDYVVDWAPGVQPLASGFSVLAEESEVNATLVSGERDPLGELDIRGLDTSHERDPDSPHGENDAAITIRIRATAHYGGRTGDVSTELRRVVYVHRDPDLAPGFPVSLGASGEASPKLADLDQDGTSEIVVATAEGLVHVLSVASGRPEPLPGFPHRLPSRAGAPVESAGPSGAPGMPAALARESYLGTPAVADLNGDDDLEIVATTWEGTIQVIDARGKTVDGWPVKLPEVSICPPGATVDERCAGPGHPISRGALASPVLADLDADGKLEVIQAGFDGDIHVYSHRGSPLPGWPRQVVTLGSEPTPRSRLLSTPVIEDFDRDGSPEILIGGSISDDARIGWYSLLSIEDEGRLTLLQHWPIAVESWTLGSLVAEGTPSAPAAADFNGDGSPEAVFHGNLGDPLIVPLDPGVQEEAGDVPPRALPVREGGNRGIETTRRFGAETNATLNDAMFPMLGQPALGDLDQDGTVDVVTAGGSLEMAERLRGTSHEDELVAQHLLAMWSGRTGAMLPGSPAVLEGYSWLQNPAIADIDGDGYPEVLAGSDGYFVHAVDACGKSPVGWPKLTGQWLAASPAVGDVDGDEQLEVVVVSRSGWLFAWNTQGSADGVIAWESFHHDNRNTGSLLTPLARGRLRGTAPPLSTDGKGRCGPAAAPPESKDAATLSPTGGCGCTVARGSPSAWWAVIAAAMGVGRRRKRHSGLSSKQEAKPSCPVRRTPSRTVAKVGLEPTTPRL